MAEGGDGRNIGPGDNLDAPTLLSIIQRLESLDKEKQSINDDIKTIKAEAKGAGFALDVVNFILRERRKDPDDVDEFNRELNKYKHALESVTEL